MILEKFKNDIKETIRAVKFDIIEGIGELSEKIVDIVPIHAKIGPKFKSKSSEIVTYLQNVDKDEFVQTIEKGIVVSFSDNTTDTITKEYVTIVKKVVDKGGYEVDLLSDLSDVKIAVVKD